MAEEHHHHHLFGHHKNEDDAPPAEYGYSDQTVTVQDTDYPDQSVTVQDTEYYDGPPAPTSYTTETTTKKTETDEYGRKHETEIKHKEHVGEAFGAAAGAYALYEGHEAKKDPEHRGRHKLEERLAEAAVAGAGGYALHEHHDEKKFEKEEEGDHHKKHHLF